MRVIVSLFFYFFLLVAHQVNADCNPTDFLIPDVNRYVLDVHTRDAFLLTATQDQWDQTKTKIGLNYAGFGLDFGQDQASARHSEELQQRNFSQDYYMNFLSQHLSAESVQAYAECLTYDRASPGLRLWLKTRAGTSVELNAFWVGTNTAQGSTKEVKVLMNDNLEVKLLPKEWTNVATLQIFVQIKDNQKDAFLSLRVGGQERGYNILHEPPPVEIEKPSSDAWIGAYGVALAAPSAAQTNNPFFHARGCSDVHGPASIFRDGTGKMIAVNECGQPAQVIASDDGKIVLLGGNIVGTFEPSQGIVFWSNGTAWIRMDAKFPFIGNWLPPERLCESGPRRSPWIGFAGNAILTSVNECSQAVPLSVSPDRSVSTIGRNSIKGTIEANGYLQWSNGSHWRGLVR